MPHAAAARAAGWADRRRPVTGWCLEAAAMHEKTVHCRRNSEKIGRELIAGLALDGRRQVSHV